MHAVTQIYFFIINLTEIYLAMHGRPDSSQPAGWPDYSCGKSQPDLLATM
jgi:hypothetical protein